MALIYLAIRQHDYSVVAWVSLDALECCRDRCVIAFQNLKKARAVGKKQACHAGQVVVSARDHEDVPHAHIRFEHFGADVEDLLHTICNMQRWLRPS